MKKTLSILIALALALGLLLPGAPLLAEDRGVAPNASKTTIPGGSSLDMVVHEPVRLSLIDEAGPPQAPPDGPGMEDHPVLGSASRLSQVTLASWVGDPDAVAVGDELALNLFADASYTATVDRVSIDTQGTVSVRGRVQACPASYILISTYGGRTLASVKIPGESRQYLILYEPETLSHYLAELDPAKVDEVQASPVIVPPPPGPEDEAEIAELQDRIAVGQDPSDPATIDVMVVYTPLAREWADDFGGGIHNVIAQAMEKAELVLDNSQVGASMRLVHSAQVDYDETQDDSVTHLVRLTEPEDGYMDEVHDWRDQYGADLVAIFARVSDTGGLAWLLTYQAGRPGYAFSLTRVQQAALAYTHIHEMGHNMGCHHHKDQSFQPGPTIWNDWPANTWSAGWRWTGDDEGHYCSVMTYTSGTYFPDGVDHVSVPYFSNPGVDYQGVPTGHAADGDNARTVREIKHVIAAYRAEVGLGCIEGYVTDAQTA